MRRMRSAAWFCAIAAIPLVGTGAADATVVIKSNRVAICVTGAKHPDACKKIAADARVVVSDEAMEDLDGEVGQGATIQSPSNGPSETSGQHRRHRQDSQ